MSARDNGPGAVILTAASSRLEAAVLAKRGAWESAVKSWRTSGAQFAVLYSVAPDDAPVLAAHAETVDELRDAVLTVNMMFDSCEWFAPPEVRPVLLELAAAGCA